MTTPFPVCLENVTKTYRNGHTALRDVSFQVGAGEIVGLLGPNGAGKTTSIKLLTTVHRPTTGTLRVGAQGDNLWECPESVLLDYKRQIGWVPEHAILYDRLTAREHLLFVGRLIGMDDRAIEARIHDLLPQFELDSASRQLLGTYSNGMQRKVTFAAALLSDPPFLVLDEPTSSLDPQGVRWVKDLIRSFREQGKGILVSTHILEIAEELCDRVVVLHKGEALFDGSVEELRRELSAQSDTSLEDLFLTLVRENVAAATSPQSLKGSL